MTWRQRFLARRRALLGALGIAVAAWYACAAWLWLLRRSEEIEGRSGTLILAEGMGSQDLDLLGALIANLTANDVKGEG